MNFCRRCGATLKNVGGHVFKCEKEHTIFANASPSSGVFFLSSDRTKVLLSVRGLEPGKGMLDAFGGFCDGAETFEDALTRELQEELSLLPSEYTTPIYLTSALMDFYFEKDPIPVITTLYFAELKTDRKLIPSDDVAGIKEVSLHNFDLSLLHAPDIRRGIMKLRELFPITQQ